MGVGAEARAGSVGWEGGAEVELRAVGGAGRKGKNGEREQACVFSLSSPHLGGHARHGRQQHGGQGAGQEGAGRHGGGWEGLLLGRVRRRVGMVE